MNFQFYVEKLKNCEKYKQFIEKNPKAIPCSGFFVIDFAGKDNQQHFDFCVDGKIFSCKLEHGGEVQEMENFGNKIPKEISLDLDFDFKRIQEMVENKMQEQEIKNKIQKFLFSYQNIDQGHVLAGTVFISGLGMLKVSINLDKMEIVEFEKKSFFDVVKVRKKS